MQDINLSLGHTQNNVDTGVVILEGRSASGKTTILRLLAGIEGPVEGKILINGQEISIGNEENRNLPSWMKIGSPLAASSLIAQPVIIESKPDFDNSKTVLEWISKMGCDAVQYHCKSSTIGKAREELIKQLSHDLAQLLNMAEEQCASRPTDLSPSSQFLFGIACGCMVSTAPAIATLNISDLTSQERFTIPSPILFFDELFDMETSSTLNKCSLGILNLIKQGSIVLSVTHRSSYFMSMTSRRITLSGGRVLTDRTIEKVKFSYEP